MFGKLNCLVLVLSIALPAIAADIDPSLVAWWKLDEGSGTAALDSSGNDQYLDGVGHPVTGLCRPGDQSNQRGQDCDRPGR